MTEQKFARGADLGWLSQLEDRGIRWVDNEGTVIDPLCALRDMGVDSVRLRVFVNPPRDAYWDKPNGDTCMLGYCDAAGVLAMSRRAADAGMRLMIDFHYSDHFADPNCQHIPAAWEQAGDAELIRHVFRHTHEVLTMLTGAGIFPEWVQVGNEINPGMMLPRCGLRENPRLLVDCLNAGYEAVKECCPECKVVTHLAGVHDDAWCIPFLDTFFALGGKTDILGFSFYPFWFHTSKEKDFLCGRLRQYPEKYQKPLLIAEVGGEEADEEGTFRLLRNTIEAVQALPDFQGQGVFYWEPEAGADFLPDRYPLGAARKTGEHTLRFTKALTAFRATEN